MIIKPACQLKPNFLACLQTVAIILRELVLSYLNSHFEVDMLLLVLFVFCMYAGYIVIADCKVLACRTDAFALKENACHLIVAKNSHVVLTGLHCCPCYVQRLDHFIGCPVKTSNLLARLLTLIVLQHLIALIIHPFLTLMFEFSSPETRPLLLYILFLACSTCANIRGFSSSSSSP